MPIIQGASKEACRKNYYELLASGFGKDQAYAIMAKTARKNVNKVNAYRRQQILAGKFL